MANKKTIVEINGRKYDANTGKMLKELPTATRVIDGFQAPIRNSTTAKAQPVVQRTGTSSKDLHAKPQKTKKLYSAGTKKPVSVAISAKSRPAANAAATPAAATHRTQQTTDSRTERSRASTKSELISRYGGTPAQDQTAPQPTPVAEPEAPVLAQPMPKPVITEEPAQPVQSIAEQQVEKPQKKSRLKKLMQSKPKLVPVTMAIVAVIAVGGFLTYQNIPNMALRVAAQRAGFNASLPGYNPSGFSFSGPVAYSEGVVELEYSSNSDERTFTITQRDSTWDSQSLLDNFVSSSSDEYQTFQERGLTVYTYGPSNATWVDGGVWYTIEGESLLTSEQILKIAGSL